MKEAFKWTKWEQWVKRMGVCVNLEGKINFFNFAT